MNLNRIFFISFINLIFQEISQRNMEVNMFYNYIFFKKLSNMKSKKKVVKNMLY